MSDTVKTERQAEGGSTRLCTAENLILKAYQRPYTGAADQPVLTLLASGEYGYGTVRMYFESVAGTPNTYKLMETVPGIVYYLFNYPAACYSSDYGLVDLARSVTVITASGEHTVPVENFA